MSRPTLTTLDHLVLTVTDIERTVAFFTDVLGMTAITFDAGQRRALRFGAHKINLHVQGHEFEPKSALPTPGSADICLLTETPLADWQAHLDARGVAVIKGPVPRSGAIGAITSLYIRDPDGNLIEIAMPGKPGM